MQVYDTAGLKKTPGGVAGAAGSISAGTTRGTLGEMVFADSNGISFGVDGQTVTAQHNALTSQSNQNITAANGGFAFQTLSFSNANNFSFGTSAGSAITGSYTVPSTAGLLSAINLSAGTTSNNLSAVTFSNGNGVSFGLNGSVVTASVAAAGGAQTGISGIQVSDNTFTSGTVTFQNANGMSFGSSGANGISASYTVPNVPPVTNSSWTVSDAASSATVGRLAFTNLNGVTLSLSTGAAGNHTIVGSHNALTSQSNQNVTAGNGGFAFQTLSFSNVNGMSFGTSAGSAITGSYTVPSTAGLLSAINASAGTTSNNLSALVFSNSNNVSFGLNGSTITASAAGGAGETRFTGYAQSNTTQSSSGTIALSSVNFAGAGIASVGISDGSVIISVPAGGGGLTNINISAGTTSNNLSALTFSNSNGVSFGLNGSVITASANGGATLSRFPADSFSISQQSLNSGTSGSTGGSTQITVSLRIGNMQLPQYLTYKTVGIFASAQTVAGTASVSGGYFVGLYTVNQGSQLSLMTDRTSQFAFVLSQNSVTARTASWWWGTNSTSNSSSIQGNVSASFTGGRWLLLDTVGGSLTPGDYYIVWGHTGRTTGANINSSASLLGNGLTAGFQSLSWGANSPPAVLNHLKRKGNISTTTNTNSTGFPVLPMSIHTSAISSAINAGISPMVFFNGVTN